MSESLPSTMTVIEIEAPGEPDVLKPASRPVPVSMVSTRSGVGGTTGSPSVRPALISASCAACQLSLLSCQSSIVRYPEKLSHRGHRDHRVYIEQFNILSVFSVSSVASRFLR